MTARGLLVGMWSVLCGLSANAQIVDVDYSQPSGDRWNYAFNPTPGLRPFAPSFAALGIPGFDDLDSQFLLSWDTGAEVPIGLSLDQYHIARVMVRAQVSNDEQFVYDPTYDSYRTLLAPAHPDFLPDEDTGRPVGLFGVGFRNGQTLRTWLEQSPYGGVPAVPPAQGARNVFAANMSGGVATDASNHVKDEFEAAPFDIGTIKDGVPGELVAADTWFDFELDPCDAQQRAYIREALQSGRLMLTIASWQAAMGGPGGGTGDPNYPIWYTRDFTQADSARLHLVVRAGNLADMTGNGEVNTDDFIEYLALFAAGDPFADVNEDCQVNSDDFVGFLVAFANP